MKKEPVKKRKKVEPVIKVESKQMPPEIINMIIENYNTVLDQQMEMLHSQFVVYISESKLPVMQVIMVLQILISEAVELAKTKYIKGG